MFACFNFGSIIVQKCLHLMHVLLHLKACTIVLLQSACRKHYSLLSSPQCVLVYTLYPCVQWPQPSKAEPC